LRSLARPSKTWPSRGRQPAVYSYPKPQTVLKGLEGGIQAPDLRLATLSKEIEVVRGYFPDSGYALADLLDWLSHRLRTNQRETFFIKDELLRHNEDDKDLAYSAVNEIVQDATSWSRVDQWKLIRWLRGSGPVPEVVSGRMRR